jgi:hypothetical protein
LLLWSLPTITAGEDCRSRGWFERTVSGRALHDSSYHLLLCCSVTGRVDAAVRNSCRRLPHSLAWHRPATLRSPPCTAAPDANNESMRCEAAVRTGSVQHTNTGVSHMLTLLLSRQSCIAQACRWHTACGGEQARRTALVSVSAKEGCGWCQREYVAHLLSSLSRTWYWMDGTRCSWQTGQTAETAVCACAGRSRLAERETEARTEE